MMLFLPALWNLANLQETVCSIHPTAAWADYMFYLTGGLARAGTLLLLITPLAAATGKDVPDKQPTTATT